jgi:hypothetical protein
MRKNKNIALHAAGVLVTYFGKKGDVSGSFDVPHMAQIIEREALQRDRKRIARRLRKAARTNRTVEANMRSSDCTHAASYADGSAFAFNRSADIALGKAK